MHAPCSNILKGFTLVELSIVLVILGLLVGGVLVGNDLIHAAELNKAIKEKETYVQATQLFKQKYHALPGDFNDATRFWGMAPNDASPAADDTACAALDETSPSEGTNTCNGNGNSKISPDSTPAEAHEAFRYWQHLSNAGLVDGRFTGVHGASGDQDSVIEQNIPRSGFNELGWGIGWLPYYDNAASFLLTYNHVLFLGAELTSQYPVFPGIAPKDAFVIDTKIDDGLPAKGDVVTLVSYTDCQTGTTPTDYEATYKTETDTLSCILIFRNLPF